MQHLKNFNEMNSEEAYEILTIDSEITPHKERFNNLPDWVWETVEELKEIEVRWLEVNTLLNNGTNYIDVVYWSTPERNEEYKKLYAEKFQIEIKASQKAAKLRDKLVEWRDTTWSIEDYYDGDSYDIPDEMQKAMDNVAYFCMYLQSCEWYKSALSTPHAVKDFERTSKMIKKKMAQRIKETGRP